MTILPSLNSVLNTSNLNDFSDVINPITGENTENNIFGWDPGDSPSYSTSTPPGGCSVCTSSCQTMCGADCEGGCSEECTGMCVGSCSNTCTLGCADSCSDTCKDNCGDHCDTSCNRLCTDSCTGTCSTACVGCTGSCSNLCSNGCVRSCVASNTSDGTRHLDIDLSNKITDAELREALNYILALNFVRMSELPVKDANTLFNPIPDGVTIFDDDQFVVNIDNTTDDPLEKVKMVVTDYSQDAVRISAAQLMKYFNSHLKNFRVWKPITSDSGVVGWELSSDDTPPDPINLDALPISLASETKNGLMSSGDYKKLLAMDANLYATYDYLANTISLSSISQTFQNDLDNKYAEKTHSHSQYVLTDTLNNNYYTSTETDNNFLKKADASNTYLKKTDASNTYLTQTDASDTYLTKAVFSETLTHYTPTETLNLLLNGKLSTEDAANLYVPKEELRTTPTDYIPLASRTNPGLLKASHYAVLEDLSGDLTTIESKIPTKVSQLENDSNYLTLSTLPIASTSQTGIVQISSSSKISVDENGIIDINNFSINNLLRNSTFVSFTDGAPDYWKINVTEAQYYSETINDPDIGTLFEMKFASFTVNDGSSISQTVYFQSNGYLTLSFETKSFVPLEIKYDGEIVATTNTYCEGNNWTRNSITFEVPIDTDFSTHAIDIVCKCTNTRYLKIRKLMLQAGCNATGWIPNSYDGAQINADAVKPDIATSSSFGIVRPDNNSLLIDDGVLSVNWTNILRDGYASYTTTWSSQKITNYIPNYIEDTGILTHANIRLHDSASEPNSGTGVLISKSSTYFKIGITAIDDAIGSMRTDEQGNEIVPLRIDLATGTCDINGNALTSTTATLDSLGRNISETYVTREEFENALTSIMTAIEALNT